MTLTRSTSFAALVGLLGLATASAQDLDPTAAIPRGWCGTITTEDVVAAERDRLASGFYDDVADRSPGDYRYIRLALHVVRRTNGTGAIPLSDIQAALNTANSMYAPSRIVLAPVALDYINSDTYYAITEPEDDALRQQNVVAGAMNLYFVGDAPYCGESTFPPNTPGGTSIQGIVLQNSCVNGGGVLAHEVGHYLLLYHTHETAFGSDCPGSPFCGSLGDLCCDTPADPGLHLCSSPASPGSCVNSSCAYTGTFTCGGQSYSPDATNTMSYTDYETCMDGFSADQRVRIESALFLPERADEIMLEHSCGVASYVAIGSPLPLGTWQYPAPTIRQGIASPRPCVPGGSGVVIIARGVYHEGPALFSTPSTFVASRDGIGAVVEIRP